MEIGHNVMHGQWDWMNDPQINSSTWDWDTASTAEAWKHSHNYVHHTYTNIRGKDKRPRLRDHADRPAPEVAPGLPAPAVLQPACWRRSSSGASPSTTSTSTRSATGEKSKEQVRRELKGMAGKARSQIVKDYVAWPLISALADGGRRVATRARAAPARAGAGTAAAARPAARAAALDGGVRTFRATLKANVTANMVRNVWAYAIIFCGHFPDQTYTFSQEEVEDETRGGWYVRQLLGAANIEGSPLFHVDQRQPRLPGRAPPLPGHAEHALRRDRAAGARDLRALRAALQHRAVLQAARHGAAHDPAAGASGRQAAAEARSLPRRPCRNSARQGDGRRGRLRPQELVAGGRLIG